MKIKGFYLCRFCYLIPSLAKLGLTDSAIAIHIELVEDVVNVLSKQTDVNDAR